MSLFQDFRFAIRTLRHRRAASLIVVLTLALGIGANTVFFASYYGMVLRPLPFQEPERLVYLNQSRPELGETRHRASAANLHDWMENNPVLTTAGAFRGRTYNFQSAEEPQPIEGVEVTAGLFPMLGVEPILGRFFIEHEDAPGGPLVALISHDVWTQRFAADPGIIGQTVRLDDEIREIVGVMPEGFLFPNEGRLWTPLQSDAQAERRDRRYLDVIARLNDGVTLEQAQSVMTALGTRLAELHPEFNEGWSVHVRPLRDQWLPPVTRLAAASQMVLVCGVLLIVCANVTNIVLAQATSRRQENALRAVLGASRARLMRLTLVESTLLALAGGSLGLMMASWGDVWTRNISPVTIPYWLEFGLNAKIVAYTVAITLATGILIGLLPSIKSSGYRLFEALKSGGSAEESSSNWVRKGLVVAEYSLALVVLVAGFLMAKSFTNLAQADMGFEKEQVLTMRLHLAGRSYDPPEVRAAYLDEVLRRLDGLAQTTAVGAVNYLPISQNGHVTTTLGARDREFPESEEPRATFQTISRGYHEALGIPMLAGRSFTAGEVREGAHVAMLGRSLADLLWPGEDPLGRRIRTLRGEPGPWLEVVGVVDDVEPGQMIAGLDMFPEHQVYVPMAGEVMGAAARMDNPPRMPFLVLRSRGDATALSAVARSEIRAADPGVSTFEVMSMDEVLKMFYFAQHIWGHMFSLIALLALVIAMVGAYGVTAYTVSQRTREMGVRIAMGASPMKLIVLVVRQGLAMAAIGVALGLMGAVPLAGAMESLLHDMKAVDPGVFTSVTLVLLAVGLLASYLPARRAARVDPITALRNE